MRRLSACLAALLLVASPALAAPKPLLFGAAYAPYRLHVTLHFPEAKERKAESRCTAAQVEHFRAYFAGYLADAAPRLVADHEAAHGGPCASGTVIGLDFRIGCSADGGATIARYTPDQNWATLYYDPAVRRWQIVG